MLTSVATFGASGPAAARVPGAVVHGSSVGGQGPASADPLQVPPGLVTTVAVGSEPVAGAVDLSSGLVYVANSGPDSNSVSVLNATAVVATVDLAPNQTGAPLYVTYDSLTGYIYVVDRYNFEGTGGAVSVLDGTSVLATIAVGSLPDMAVVDPSNGYVYVTNSGGTGVTVISGTAAIANVTVGTHPCAAVYDALDDYVYVANCGSANVSLLFGTDLVGSLPAGVGPVSVAYDPLDGYVYVVNNVSGNVTVDNDISVVGNVPVGSDPVFVAFDPSVGGVEVANSNSSNVTVLNGTVAVATVAVGAGPVWVGVAPFGPFTFVVDEDANAVTLLQGTASAGNVSVGAVPTYGVADPSNQREYVVNSGSNNVSIFALTYPVTFNETGLAAGVDWSVTLGGSVSSSTSPSIGFTEPSGSYAYSVGTPSGYELVSSQPASPVSVTNRSVVVNVTFSLLPSTPYTLTFVETGLGTSCSSHGGSMGPDGSSMCCRSSPLAWSVNVSGVTKTTTNTSLAFSELDGTYNYTIYPPSGYNVTSSVPPSPVTIYGANLTVNVTFGPPTKVRTLSITFWEMGLRHGTTWCVTTNTTECSSGQMIVFSGLSPGTYAFQVSPVTGYTAQPASGSVALSDRSVFVLVKFLPNGHHPCGG